MAKLRHIYRSNKLTNIPQRRYARKYNPDYLKEKASHGASLKEGFGDFDGDGDLDGIYPKQRAGVAEKPGIYINAPRRGPRNLSAFGLPQYGPTNLIVPPPESGPQNLTSSTALPQLGPTDLSTVIEASSVGPALLEASIIAPAAGPSNLVITNPPAAGPSSLSGSVDYNVSLTIDSDTTYIKGGITYPVDATVHGHYTYYPSGYNPYYLKSLNLNCTAYTGDEIRLQYVPEIVGSDYVEPQRWLFTGDPVTALADSFYYRWLGPIGVSRPVTFIVTGSKTYGSGTTC